MLCVFFFLFFFLLENAFLGKRDKNAVLGLVNSIQIIFFSPHFKREARVAKERRSFGSRVVFFGFSDA